ncbi:MAG: hypothetical protein ACOCXJ_05455, partial [Planctomycetota bacterium]
MPVAADGWWVDEDLRCWRLPDLPAGRHELLIRQALGSHHRLEWCYLLGDFDVELHGAQTRVQPVRRPLLWGDATRQGLPFYAGNIAYQTSITHTGGGLWVQVPRFAAHAVEVTVDGRVLGWILEERERFPIDDLPAGIHELVLTALGSRCNAFGPLHNADPAHRMEAPHSWLTRDASFSRSYRVQPMG